MEVREICARLVSCPPFTCHWGRFFVAEGQPPRRADEPNPVVLNRLATPGYFRAMGIRLRFGRFFEDSDGRDAGHPVVIVNETFTWTFFPGIDDPVGRRIRINDDEAPWWTIVGVAQDVKHYGLERPMRPGLYLPVAQVPGDGLTVAMRTTVEPTSLIGTARGTVAALDPELPLFRIQTMEQALAESLMQRQLYSVLLLTFALLALALGGTYGVTSYLVTQRTREIGIRVALGARTAAIVGTVLGGGLRPAALGTVTGLVAAVLLTGLMGDLLFDVPPYDGLVLAGAILLLGGAACLGNCLPARRAALVDPMRTLRVE